MNAQLKRVWVAAAAVEMRRAELDRAEAALNEAIGEAMDSGEDPDTIAGAVNLMPAGPGRAVQAGPGEIS
jgi:hypothetical protein